jgi:hypothetical protein
MGVRHMFRKILTGFSLVHRAIVLAGVGLLALGVAGCVETMPQMQVNVPAGATRIAARPGVSPAGATVAFVNLGGAPTQVGTRFAASMSNALGARNISSEEPAKAHYLIRGNMTAYSVDGGGTAVGYVWDIYDAKRRRLQRLEDEIVVKGTATDPWGAVDDAALASIAGRSADEIAAFLTNMPEAVAAAGAGSATAAVNAMAAPAPAGASGRPLAYAPIR